MRHVDGIHKKIKNRDSAPIFEVQKIPWVSKCATLMVHIKKIENKDSTPMFFFMCALNVAYLETQGIFWTSKIGTESLFSIFFNVWHQHGAFGNPGNLLDFKNRRGIPIFLFFLCVPSTWRIWKLSEFFGI